MLLMRSVGSWLILCLSSNSRCKWQSRKNDFTSLAWPLMRSAKVSGAVEGGSGVKGRSDRRLMTQAGERQRENERSHWVQVQAQVQGRQNLGQNFISHVLTPQQMNTCHPPLQPSKNYFLPTYARNWQLRKKLSLFLLPYQELLFFRLCSGSQIIVLSEVAWHACKCFAYFVTWFGYCMHFFWWFFLLLLVFLIAWEDQAFSV